MQKLWWVVASVIQTHKGYIFAALGLHTTKTFTTGYALIVVMLFGFCFVPHALKTNDSSFETHWDSIAFHLSSSFSSLFLPLTLHPLLLPFCLSAPSHIYSSLSHLVDDSLVFESCAFCSMICSVVSLLLPGLSLPLPSPSPPWKPTDFNVRVCLRCPYFYLYNLYNNV